MNIQSLIEASKQINEQYAGNQTVSKSTKLDNFSEMLHEVGTSIVEPQQQAAEAVEKFTSGMNGKIHETMLAVEKADISLKYMMNVRNKLIEAYREIMRMGA